MKFAHQVANPKKIKQPKINSQIPNPECPMTNQLESPFIFANPSMKSAIPKYKRRVVTKGHCYGERCCNRKRFGRFQRWKIRPWNISKYNTWKQFAWNTRDYCRASSVWRSDLWTAFRQRLGRFRILNQMKRWSPYSYLWILCN